ncbi:hypothetical protein C8R44DRAFT_891454 [Mycena epipterygia]|nr:hypothetical protein C8R44DRAFT_891454 [Mycena epipterygia]
MREQAALRRAPPEGAEYPRQSTTIRKSRDLHKLADERVEIDLEIEAIRAEKQESAARLKTLQARKSELRKKRKAAKANGGHTVFVSANSSGRVKTRTIGVSSVLQNAVPVQPIASTSAAPVEYASSANSGAATFVGSNQGRAYIAPAPAVSACPNAADSVVPTSAPAIFPPYPPLADFGGYIAPPDVSNFGDGMGFNPNFDFNNFDNFDFNFEWSLLPDDLSLPCQRRFFLLNGTPQISAPSSPRLPPIPISSSPLPMSPAVALAPKPVSRKRKSNIDGLDLINVIETTRARKVRQRID